MTSNKPTEGFEKQLFKAADKLRKNIDAAEFAVLGHEPRRPSFALDGFSVIA